MSGLALWVICNHPSDVPEPFGFTVREWEVTPAGAATGDSRVQFAMTLEDARNLVPAGLYCLPRSPDDDPVIVETWL